MTLELYNILLSSLLVLGSYIKVGSTTSSQQKCLNLSPCTCDTGILANNTFDVKCDTVPMKEVKIVFNQTDPPIDLELLSLSPDQSEEDFVIPANLLSHSRVIWKLRLQGNPQSFQLLRVHPKAFRSSSNTLHNLDLSSLDARNLNFKFLEGFQNVREITFSNVSNLELSLPTLPLMPALKELYIIFIHGVQSGDLNKKWRFENNSIALQRNGLNKLVLSGTRELNQNGLVQLLDWILPNSSHTLRELLVPDGAKISSIPRQLSTFKRLEKLTIENNKVNMAIPSRSIYMSSDGGKRAATIQLTSNRLVRVESGAFQGNYTSAEVDLSKNLLTRFEEGAFKSMLQDLPLFLSVVNNPFDCYSDPCHLAWLLRDNRQLLVPLVGAICVKDSRTFRDLSPSLFKGCDKVPSTIQNAASSHRNSLFLRGIGERIIHTKRKQLDF